MQLDDGPIGGMSELQGHSVRRLAAVSGALTAPHKLGPASSNFDANQGTFSRKLQSMFRAFHVKAEEPGMKLLTVRAAATFAAVILICMPIRASYAENDPAWCANSGYDNGPARERGPGTGPYWSGEPTDCRSIWRRGHYRGTDPDPNIRLQIMRWKAPRHHYKSH
jgi:hypothetical protein